MIQCVAAYLFMTAPGPHRCVGLLSLRAAGAALVAGVHVVPDLVAGSFVSLACVSL